MSNGGVLCLITTTFQRALATASRNRRFRCPASETQILAAYALLFLLTILTTLIIGARLQDNFINGRHRISLPTIASFHCDGFGKSVVDCCGEFPFSATLLGILMAHEMGHFIYSVRHGVYATLPFFLPAPRRSARSGAFIQIKSAFRSRVALFDIGIAGPIAGFIVAVPMAVVGLMLSRPMPVDLDPKVTQTGQPLKSFPYCIGLWSSSAWARSRNCRCRLSSFIQLR